MKSKELLESIKHTIEGVFYPRKMYKKTSDEFKQLERDLEVLEILKKFSIELCNCINYTSLTNEEFELLKEWLEK